MKPLAVTPLCALLLCAAGVPSPAAAQVAAVCPAGEPECARAVQSAVDARARAVLVVSGGAPLPGSASTLGRRTATSRHAGVALRLTAVGSDAFAPPAGGTETAGSSTLVALSVDGAVALFDGFVVAPTVGGVLSVDALASAGWLRGGGPIEARGAFVWGAGVRVGVLRESFTLPGLTVSAMYRDVATLTAGDPEAPPRWEADADALSLRATIGKRIGALDAFGGGGWDRAAGSVAATYTNASSQPEAAGVRDLDEGRWNAFAGLGWTFLVFQVAGEAGWVEGGAGHAEETFRLAGSDGAWFGTLSFRFTY